MLYLFNNLLTFLVSVSGFNANSDSFSPAEIVPDSPVAWQAPAEHQPAGEEVGVSGGFGLNVQETPVSWMAGSAVRPLRSLASVLGLTLSPEVNQDASPRPPIATVEGWSSPDHTMVPPPGSPFLGEPGLAQLQGPSRRDKTPPARPHPYKRWGRSPRQASPSDLPGPSGWLMTSTPVGATVWHSVDQVSRQILKRSSYIT
ncbi:unnamed protein product [Bursaphelenchus okinawaensis]|uniref:Uncharacterized protein n=1 Tax=Bursaphelenchus okinawaensis TaxID=465554 RepID=A0A811K3C2_9BILA|nr:unnamed protein product [Bursaphelenchus okinawaensis]CAG9091073.1 unnamed protein product [Bursaphelenchus okinawaensis]